MPRGVRRENIDLDKFFKDFEPYLRVSDIYKITSISLSMLNRATKAGMADDIGLPVGDETRYRPSEVVDWFRKHGRELSEKAPEGSKAMEEEGNDRTA